MIPCSWHYALQGAPDIHVELKICRHCMLAHGRVYVVASETTQPQYTSGRCNERAMHDEHAVSSLQLLHAAVRDSSQATFASNAIVAYHTG